MIQEHRARREEAPGGGKEIPAWKGGVTRATHVGKIQLFGASLGRRVPLVELEGYGGAAAF